MAPEGEGSQGVEKCQAEWQRAPALGRVSVKWECRSSGLKEMENVAGVLEQPSSCGRAAAQESPREDTCGNQV